MKIPRVLILVLTILIVAVFFKRDEAKPSEILREDSQAQLESRTPGIQKANTKTATSQPRAHSSTNPQSSPSSSLGGLPDSEQKSLWKAFSEARREARPIPESWAQREENIGYDFYALHPKQNLTTRFGSQGVQFVSSDRTYSEEDEHNSTTAWEARMHLLSFAGSNVPLGAPAEKTEGSSSRVEYRHRAELTEWYDNGVAGMEHGYTIAQRPRHLQPGEEVVLEVALNGLQAADHTTEDGSFKLNFNEGERTVLSYSKLLVIDAQGNELPASMKPTDDGFLLAYNDAQATYPVTVDPLIVNEEAKLTANDAAESDWFGFPVAIAGDSVVVGAFADDDGGSGSGSAYVFTRNGSSWSQQAKLTADDAATGDGFGNSVAISGASVVVGASGDDDGGINSGSAYVFTRSGTSWSQQDKLTAYDAEASDSFGKSVAISGDSVVVGAALNDDAGFNSGSAYVFTRSGTLWSEQDKLTSNDIAENDRFGISVAISGDSVVVGASRDDDRGDDSGSAYVFTRIGTSWLQQDKLIANDGVSDDNFGISVDISGASIVVGANENNSDSGGAYVFIRSGTSWSQQAKLTANDGAAGDHFGISVAISGDSVVVGARFDDDGGTDSGSAYLFTRSGTSWSQQDKLTAGDAAVDDYFGSSVAISGDSVVIGAHLNDDDGINSGSVYIYRFAVSGERELLVFDSFGAQLLDSSSATPFAGQLLETSLAYIFRLTNAGELDLDLQSISLGGANLSEFSLSFPDISSSADLPPSKNLDLTITFSPSGVSSALRNATIMITSNDSNTPVLTFNISGLGLSNSNDGDGDGLNDWSEYSLGGVGFDWETAQPNRVNDLLNNASTAGLFTESQLAAVNVSGSLVEVDAATNTAAIVIGLEESDDLTNFNPIIAELSNITIDGQGRIRYEVNTSADKKFIRAGVGE